MTAVDRALLVLLTGALAIRVALSDLLYRYLKPGMRPWLTLAGCLLVVVASHRLLLAWRDRTRAPVGAGSPDHDDEHAPSHRIGWLLALPVAIAVLVGPGPLGSYAAGRQSTLRDVPERSFDLAAHLEAYELTGAAVPLRLVDVVNAANDPQARSLLADRTVALTGFVVTDPDAPESFLLTRFVVGCCAADALPAQVRVQGVAVPDEESWVEVQGVVRDEPPGEDFVPELTATSVRGVREPSKPYEFP